MEADAISRPVDSSRLCVACVRNITFPLTLQMLDEPSARQSDPTVLTLQLRTLSKEAPGNKAEMIGRIEHTDENKTKKISGWINSVQVGQVGTGRTSRLEKRS